MTSQKPAHCTLFVSIRSMFTGQSIGQHTRTRVTKPIRSAVGGPCTHPALRLLMQWGRIPKRGQVPLCIVRLCLEKEKGRRGSCIRDQGR